MFETKPENGRDGTESRELSSNRLLEVLSESQLESVHADDISREIPEELQEFVETNSQSFSDESADSSEGTEKIDERLEKLVEETTLGGGRDFWFWERLIAKEFIGLDIGGGAIKFVHILKARNRVKVLDYQTVSLGSSAGEDFELAAKIKTLLGRRRIKSTNIITCISGPSLNVRVIKMPRVSKKQIREALLWKNRKELHFFNDAPTMLDYMAIDDENESGVHDFNILVLAVEEDLVKRHIEILAKSGIVPRKVIAKPIATWNGYSSLAARSGDEVLIDLGFDSTSLCFFHEGKLKFARELAVGGNHFTASLMDTIFSEKQNHILSWQEAERIKSRHGLISGFTRETTEEGIPLNEVASLLRPVAEKMLSEIQMSISYYRENLGVEKIDRALVTGGGVRLPNLIEYLEQNLGIPVSVYNPVSGTVMDGHCAGRSEMITGSAVAVGSALSDGPYMNYAPPALKSQIRYSRYLSLFFRFVAVTGLLLAMTTGFWFYERMMKQNAMERSEASLELVRPQGAEHDRLLDRQRRLLATRAKIVGETATENILLNHLKLVSSAVPENIVLTELTYGAVSKTELVAVETGQKRKPDAPQPGEENTLVFKGRVFKNLFYADVHLINLIGELEGSGFFSSVELKEKKRDSKTRELHFEIICRR